MFRYRSLSAHRLAHYQPTTVTDCTGSLNNIGVTVNGLRATDNNYQPGERELVFSGAETISFQGLLWF